MEVNLENWCQRPATKHVTPEIEESVWLKTGLALDLTIFGCFMFKLRLF